MQPDFVDEMPSIKNTALYTVLQDNPKVIENLKIFSELVVADINNNDPDYFNDFENGMKSMDETIIVSTLEKATEKLFESFSHIVGDTNYIGNDLDTIFKDIDFSKLLDEDGNVNPEELKAAFDKYGKGDIKIPDGSQNQGMCVIAGIVFIAGVYVFVGAVFNIAAAVNVGVAVNAGVAVNGWLYVNVTRYGNLNFSKPVKNLHRMAMDTEMMIHDLAVFPYIKA